MPKLRLARERPLAAEEIAHFEELVRELRR
jgi:hypothetical protein